MELKGQESSLGYNPIFRGSSETLDRRHHHLQQNPSGPNADQFDQKSSGSSGARYRECLKNHAASVGGNVLDGCGEFMPSGDNGTLEALKCAACSCHRNFHRKEVDGVGGGEPDFPRSTMLHPLQLPPPLPSPSLKQHQRIPLGVHGNPWTSIIPPVKVAFGGGGGSAGTDDSSSEELNFNSFQFQPSPPAAPFALSKKRFRTKFTQEQKEKMMGFAEKVGWRIPREDDAEVQRFCAEVGVKRQVLKVWMHNNKNTTKKQNQQQQQQQQPIISS